MKYKTNYLTNEEIEQIYQDKQKRSVKCKCGHTVVILDPKGYQICSWCRNYAFATPKIEFEYRMKEKILKEKRNRNEKYNNKEN